MTVRGPIRLCYECGQSSRRAPLIACDYCPLYFHQDCLDPPLTTLPSGRWMCPNHPNHFVDQNLLQSCSASERLKLWDEFATQRIDQQAVKLEFIRKARCANPRFRMKVKLEDRLKVKVPALVKFYYDNPPSVESVTHNRMRAVIRNKSDESNCNSSDLEDEQVTSNNNLTTRLDNNKEPVIKDESDCVEMSEAIDEKVSDAHMPEKVRNSRRRSDSCDSNFECDSREGIQLLSRKVLEVLAEQRIEQLLNPEFECYNSVDCKSRVRAAVFSLTAKPLPPAFMVKNTLTIGTGPNSDLVLSDYGRCDFISSKHAIIFYDEVITNFMYFFLAIFFFNCFLLKF